MFFLIFFINSWSVVVQRYMSFIEYILLQLKRLFVKKEIKGIF